MAREERVLAPPLEEDVKGPIVAEVPPAEERTDAAKRLMRRWLVPLRRSRIDPFTAAAVCWCLRWGLPKISVSKSIPIPPWPPK